MVDPVVWSCGASTFSPATFLGSLYHSRSYYIEIVRQGKYSIFSLLDDEAVLLVLIVVGVIINSFSFVLRLTRKNSIFRRRS